ncbi:MAG: hypothetical protein WCD76_03885 [Pyrinomonadaceae bacterium]
MSDALDGLLEEIAPAPVQDAPEWETFPHDSGSLNIPRAAMPQIKSEHRGAMVQFLKGRGISHTQEEIAPSALKPSQLEYSPEKVEKARSFEGPNRSILVSADDHVLDGHHQWLSSLHDAPDTPAPAIRLHAPAQQLLIEMARFPSSGVDEASKGAAPPLAHSPRSLSAAPAPEPDALDGLLEEMKRPASPTQAPSSDWHTLSEFAEGQGFTVTSTTRGRHNSGSAHYAGRAVDVRTRDKTPEQIAALDEAARAAGFIARDERTRPPGQSEWHGPHYHLETGGAAPVGDDLDGLLDGLPATAAPGDALDQLLDSVPAHADEDAPDEIVTTSTPRYTGGPQTSHTLPMLPMSANPDLQTMEGRAQRDMVAAHGSDPNANLTFDLSLPHGFNDWSELTGDDAARASVRQYAQTHDIPAPFVEKFLAANGSLIHMRDKATGESKAPADYIYEGSEAFDFEKRTLRVSARMPLLKKLRDDFMASLSPLDRAGEWAFGSQESPGEKLVDVAAPVAHAAEVASRPFSAVPDAAVWSKIRSGSIGAGDIDPLTAYAIERALMGEEVPDYAKNPLGAGVRHSQTLANINPRLPALAGSITEMLTSPSNLLGLGVGKVGMEALKSSRLGAGVAAGLSEAMGGESKLAAFFNRGGRILDIEAAPIAADAPVIMGPGGISGPGEANPLPEFAHTIDAQLQALSEGTRGGVLITPGSPMPQVPKGMTATETARGTLIHNPAVISPEDARAVVAADQHYSLLGHVAPKTEESTAFVVATDASGRELQISYTRPEDVAAQIEAMRAQFPDARFEVGGRVLESRLPRPGKGGDVSDVVVTLKDHEGNLHRINTSTGEVEQVKTLPRILGMSVPDALEKHPNLDRHVAERLANAESRAAAFEAEAAHPDLPDEYRLTHAEEAARAHDEAAYLRDVQAAIEEHRNPPAPPTPPAEESRPLSVLREHHARRVSEAEDSIRALDEQIADGKHPDGAPLDASELADLKTERAHVEEERKFYDGLASAIDTHHAEAGVVVGASTSPPSLLRRVGRQFVNAYHLPKSAQASADLSATMRQGLIPLAAHPSFISDVMANQVKAFASQEAADALRDAILEHPDFNLMKESGLYLSSVRGSAPEEMFQSAWSEHIPVVKQSDRAYSAALDTVRVKSFEIYTAELKAAGVTDEKTFSDIAHWINRATGRGEGKLVDALAPVLNVPLFSPRLTASRFQVLNPVFYMKMTPAARRIAVREMMRATGTVSATVGLAVLAGAHTSLDPRNANFGKIVVGNTHLDIGGGEFQAVRYLSQMTDAFAREAKGEKLDDKWTPTAITQRFMRSKLGPVPSYAVDVHTGKDYSGNPVEWKSRALQMAVPFVVNDLREGWKDSGAWGALKASPAVLGVGVNTYKEKPVRGGRFGGGRSHSYTNSEPQDSGESMRP